MASVGGHHGYVLNRLIFFTERSILDLMPRFTLHIHHQFISWGITVSHGAMNTAGHIPTSVPPLVDHAKGVNVISGDGLLRLSCQVLSPQVFMFDVFQMYRLDSSAIELNFFRISLFSRPSYPISFSILPIEGAGKPLQPTSTA